MKFCQRAFFWAMMWVGLALPGQAAAQSWTATNIYGNWTSLAMTADGTRIAADSYLSGIFVSTDGGTSWSDAGAPDQVHRSVLVASTNGGNLVVAYNGGGIYTSSDWGLNWLPSGAATNTWSCHASSGDGTRLVAGTSPGEIYTSQDSGATFTARLPPNNFYQAIAASADGSQLVAVVDGGNIYRSTDMGDTWAVTPAPSADWAGIASSTNGANVAAVIQGGGIYTSSDFGDSWALTSAPSTNWSAVASSADGSQLVAAVNGGTLYGGGPIYISTDAGATWSAASVPPNYWSAVYSSPDGVRLLAVATVQGWQAGGSTWWSTNSGTSWSQLTINSVPRTTNVICADTFSLSIISSNWSSHAFATNFYVTNFTSLGLAVSNNPVMVTNDMGFQLTVTSHSRHGDTAAVSDLLGISVAGTSLVGLGPFNTNQLGTNLLGNNWLGSNASITNAVVARLAIPAGNSGILASTNLVQVVETNLSGLTLIASNALNVQIAPGIAPQSWSAIGASADGSRWLAAANGGWIYTSTNSGLTWTTNAGLIRTGTNAAGPWTTNIVSSPSQSWSAVACSADGTKLVAAAANGGIFTASNSGATWVSNNVPWQIADGEIATSSNSIVESQGVVWFSNSVPSQVWSAIYCSPDGNTLVALARSGWSYKSTNGGATWSELSALDDYWQSIASSASGSNLLAASLGGYVYMSTNAGTSWNELAITPGSTSVLTATTFTLNLIYTNVDISKSDTNYFITNVIKPIISIPAFTLSTNVAVANQILGVTNVVGINLIGTNATGTNIINSTFGVSIQGSNVFAVSPVASDSYGGVVFGTNFFPTMGFSNVVATSFAIPGATGLANTNGLVNTSLTNILNTFVSTSASGIAMSLTNVLKIKVVVANVMQNWSAVASSADGSHLAAAVNGGLIYVSTNSGATWTPTSAPSTNWSALAMSADGSQLTAAVNGGLIYSSTNSGADWMAADVPAANWSAVATSANGAELVAVVQGGVIYSTGTGAVASTVPPLQIQMVQGNVVLAWPAVAVNVVLQQKTNLMGQVWTDVSAAPVVANGQNQVVLPASPSQALYRLRSK